MRCLKESYDELWICSAQAGVPRSAFVHLKADPLLVWVPVSYGPSQEDFGSEYELISLRKGLIMSRQTLISLAASVIVGMGCIATISTHAFAYRRGVGVGRA